MSLSIEIPIVDGNVLSLELSAETEAAVRRLSGDPEPYFTLTPEAFNVALKDLVQTRARPDGVASAVNYMIEAASGRIPRRAPISISSADANGKHRVLDGNSTVTIARAAGWSFVPCTLSWTAQD